VQQFVVVSGQAAKQDGTAVASSYVSGVHVTMERDYFNLLSLRAERQIELQNSPHYTGAGATVDSQNDAKTAGGNRVKQRAGQVAGGVIEDILRKAGMKEAANVVDDITDNANRSAQQEDRNARQHQQQQQRLEEEYVRQVNRKYDPLIEEAQLKVEQTQDEYNLSVDEIRAAYDSALEKVRDIYGDVSVGADNYIKNTRTPTQRGRS